MKFKIRLRELRKTRGITQVDLAASINIKERQYQNLEAGTYFPSFATLLALAEYFDVSIDYLVGRSDNPERR